MGDIFQSNRGSKKKRADRGKKGNRAGQGTPAVIKPEQLRLPRTEERERTQGNKATRGRNSKGWKRAGRKKKKEKRTSRSYVLTLKGKYGKKKKLGGKAVSLKKNQRIQD